LKTVAQRARGAARNGSLGAAEAAVLGLLQRRLTREMKKAI
jgi:hypothetical protein